MEHEGGMSRRRRKFGCRCHCRDLATTVDVETRDEYAANPLFHEDPILMEGNGGFSVGGESRGYILEILHLRRNVYGLDLRTNVDAMGWFQFPNLP
jgi:hypothetical protein